MHRGDLNKKIHLSEKSQFLSDSTLPSVWVFCNVVILFYLFFYIYIFFNKFHLTHVMSEIVRTHAQRARFCWIVFVWPNMRCVCIGIKTSHQSGKINTFFCFRVLPHILVRWTIFEKKPTFYLFY